MWALGVAGVVFGSQQAGPGVPPGGVCLTKLSNGLASPDPQQPIGCQMWALDVAGIVFGGQQAGPKALRGDRV